MLKNRILLTLPMSILATDAIASVNLNGGMVGELVQPASPSSHWNNYQITLKNNGSSAIELHQNEFRFDTPSPMYSAPWGVSGASVTLKSSQANGDMFTNTLVFASYNGTSRLLKPGESISMTFGYSGILDSALIEASFRFVGDDNVVEPNNAPSVTLSRPSSNISIIEGQSLTLTAQASDVDGDLAGVKFFVNDRQVSDDKVLPYEFNLSDLGVGTHSVYVKAYDSKGNITQSVTRTVTVESNKGTAPEIGITQPTGQVELQLGDSLNVVADASDVDNDLAGVEFYVDGQKLTTKTQPPFNFQFTPANEGLYTFHTAAYDIAGNRTESPPQAFKVTAPVVETTPPVISIVSPQSHVNTLSGESIVVAAQASDVDGDLTEVRFYANGELLATKKSAPYTAVVIAQEGRTAIVAEAIDAAGHKTRTSEINITAKSLSGGDSSGGSCDVPQYQNGGNYAFGDKVQNNGSIYVCKQFGWCGQAPYEPGVAWNGSNFWQDAWEVEGACDAQPNVAPSISVVQPNVTANSAFVLSANTSDEDGQVAKVEYYIDGILTGTSSQAPFTLNHQGLSEGDYQLFAVATDDKGAQTRSENVALNVEQAFEGNRLAITFPSFDHKDLLNPPVELQDQVLTGSLYCPTDGTATKIEGTWGETINIDGLGEDCLYQLNLDGFSGYVARFSPWVVNFANAEERQIDINALYRAPIATEALFPLGGVKVETYLEGIYQPRSMAMGDNMIFVGSSSIMLDSEPLGGTIYAVQLDPQTKQPIGTYVVAEGEEPHGVAYRDGNLYYSTVGALYKIENINETFKSRPVAEKIFTYPADGTKTPIPTAQWWTRMQHQKHPLKFNTVDATDKKLYTAAGLPCNICTTPEEELYGTIFAIDLETGEYEIQANGIRNSVGFDWHPKTGEIWFSDNNRQQFDNPDEINRISNPGNQNFGAPIFFGKDTRGLTDHEMENWQDLLLGGEGSDGYPIIPPKAILPQIDYDVVKPTDYAGAEFDVFTNSAPLGVKFWNAYSQSDNIQHLVYATHGNSKPEHPGLELRMVTIQNGTDVIHERPLVTGWMKDRQAVESYACLTDACIGRPVEFLELNDGSMLVSDDKASVIYRVSYDATGANQKQITFTTTEAPDSSLSEELVSGALIHPNGHESKFHVAWNAPSMNIDGLENGTYQVRLNDVGEFIPEQRIHSITISNSAPTAAIELKYVEKPKDLVGVVKFTAPAKPANATESSLRLTFIDKAQNKTFEREVAWGASLEETLDYGAYEVRFPYLKNYFPQPSKLNVAINESSLEHNLDVEFIGFNSGEDLIAQNCNACHSTEFFDNANKANAWNNAGYDALINKIMSMPVAGHCDLTCAQEIADYLFDEVWSEYLGQTESYGDRQVRLLTNLEYANTIQDLFAITVDKQKLPKDKYEREFKFAGQSSQGIILTEDMKQYHAMAVDIASRIDLASIGYSENVNKAQFISKLGQKIYRRPLTTDEQSRFSTFLGQYGARDLVASMLLSPNFLYRSELGTLTDEAHVYELSQYEVATALSYSFLGTTPSESLLAKASRGELETNEQVAAEVASMLTSSRGIARFTDFIGYYIHTQVQELPEKPGLTTEVVNAMVQEQAEFIRYFLTEGKGTVAELFNPNFTFVNGALAKHYGISGVTGDEFQKVVVDNGQRGGLLQQGLTHVVNSDYAATSLVKRGLMIRQNLLCRTIGVPVDVDPDSIELPETPITTRERWDTINGQDASAGQCWQCHEFMNDTGASMENYSQTGEWRTTEPAYNDPSVTLPIDASGPLVDNSGSHVMLEFNNVRDISAHFPTNATVLQCLADSYFRYAMGQEANANSNAGIQDMTKQLEKSGSITEMLETLATSQMFKFKKESN
ncbi:ABC transporter substrate-binding protein [Vibrio xuii]|nr:ABC transporter substrate-binding protein [Vibrio xuii]